MLCLADHPAYVRVDYDDPAGGTGEDMEDGEIPDPHVHAPAFAQQPQHQHPYQASRCIPSMPASVFGVKAP